MLLDNIAKSPKEYKVRCIDFKTASPFVMMWHYSKKLPPCKYYFGLFAKKMLIGVMAFGQPANKNQAKEFYNLRPDKLIELRRLCCIDDTPKNTESYFIGHCLRWLKKHTELWGVLSLADTQQGHEGTIYKATNFKYIEKTKSKHYKYFLDGKPKHCRHVFDELRKSLINPPYKLTYIQLKKYYGNRVTRAKVGSKHKYLYDLR